MSEKQDPHILTRADGVVSRLLHSEEDAPDTEVTVTWVEVEPGSEQVTHSHQPGQVYVIISGEGRMHLGGTQRRVSAGDCMHIPPNAEHGIENTGEDKLEYVSAATPSLPREQIDESYRSQDS